MHQMCLPVEILCCDKCLDRPQTGSVLPLQQPEDFYFLSETDKTLLMLR